MSGQTTDHIRPRTHRATAAITRTSSNSTETRADVRSAARVLVELNVTDMGITLGEEHVAIVTTSLAPRPRARG